MQILSFSAPVQGKNRRRFTAGGFVIFHDRLPQSFSRWPFWFYAPLSASRIWVLFVQEILFLKDKPHNSHYVEVFQKAPPHNSHYVASSPEMPPPKKAAALKKGTAPGVSYKRTAQETALLNRRLGKACLLYPKEKNNKKRAAQLDKFCTFW